MTTATRLIRASVPSMAPSTLLPPRLPPLVPLAGATEPRRVRSACRSNILTGPTAQMAPGFLQANLVVVERRYAFDFLMFSLLNSKACPLLDVVNGTESRLAPDSDLRTDVPRYRVWHRGRLVDEPLSVRSVWPMDGIGFLLGCSFSFEADLRQRGLLAKDSSSVSMYRTSVPNVVSGPFGGNLVVSMRMFEPSQVDEVVQITSKHALSHGAPVAIGFQGQQELGIRDLNEPDFGEIPLKDATKVPVFWACGVTPQSAIENIGDALGDSLIITHSPGCMFVTDIPSR